MENIVNPPSAPAAPVPKDISLRILPPDDPLHSYPPNIQKAIYLLAGIVRRIHGIDKKN